MVKRSKMIKVSHSIQRQYIRDPEENWNIREDVAGYEYPEEGDNYRIRIPREVMQKSANIAVNSLVSWEEMGVLCG
jgi:hypothetical protein